MKELEIFISLLGTVFTLLITTLTFIFKYSKSAKAKNILLSLNQVAGEVIPMIKEAEKLTNYTGEEKKAYVMTKLERFVINNNLKITKEDISNVIEELICLTNVVNIKKNEDTYITKKQNDNQIKNYTPSKNLKRLY